MVQKLFRDRQPRPSDLVLDPGCGDGRFIQGILRHCSRSGIDPPRIVGIETDPKHLARAQATLGTSPGVDLLQQDYLAAPLGPAEYVVGNPPYVGITGLDAEEKSRYRQSFATAVGRFDLYILFFERSLANLKPGGRLVFVTPEKFEYVHTAEPLRRLLAGMTVEEVHHLDEKTFPDLVTFPTVTTVVKQRPTREHETRIIFRDGREVLVRLPTDGSAWSSAMQTGMTPPSAPAFTLRDVCIRISCGVATGTDEVFVQPEDELPKGLRPYAYPTISGRQLGLIPAGVSEARATKDVMLIPYDKRGVLLPEDALGDLRTYLRRPDIYRKLIERTHVSEGGRAYYRFHDSVPLPDMLRPKIVCKDIAAEPRFWADRTGKIVPRHSVYYLVPKDGIDLGRLLAYLNGPEAGAWLKSNSQRAANGFYRLQATILKRLPVPDSLVASSRPHPKRKATNAPKATKRPLMQTLLREA